MGEAREKEAAAGHPSVRSGRLRQRVVWWSVGVLGGIALVALGYAPLLRGIATALVVEDALEPAAAIVVLAGHLPFRAIEAADLYHAGWAPRLILVRGTQREERKALHALGVVAPEEWQLNRTVLVHLGVPSSAILVPEGEADGTLEELQTAARALSSDSSPVIIVTSKVHTRRVRLTWHYASGGRSRGIVRPARRDPFDSRWWWRERRFAHAVTREYLGLLNYWAGFPVAAQATDGHPAE